MLISALITQIFTTPGTPGGVSISALIIRNRGPGAGPRQEGQPMLIRK